MPFTSIRNLLKGFVIFKNNGSAVNSVDRKNLNFIPGTGITITAVDNSGSDQVDVTVNSTSTGPTVNQVMAYIAAY